MKESILDEHFRKCRAKSNLLRMLTLLLFALCTTTVFAQQKNTAEQLPMPQVSLLLV